MDRVDRETAHATELLAFRLGDQEYCVDIMSVREIRGWTRATPLPFAPGHVKGVINLRGTILPVIDLAVRLGMDAVAGAGDGFLRCVGHLRHGPHTRPAPSTASRSPSPDGEDFQAGRKRLNARHDPLYRQP